MQTQSFKEISAATRAEPGADRRIAEYRADCERQIRSFERNPLRRFAFELRRRWEQRGL